MSLRRIPGKSQEYHLISYDKRGQEVLDSDGTRASARAIDALSDDAAAITDVFVLSHGWQGDYDDAIRQYDRWVGATNPDTGRDGVRPFVIGLHWPSKAWSDRELRGAPSGLLGEDGAAAGDDEIVTVADAIEEYAPRFGDGTDARNALRTILEYAADIDSDRDATADDELPGDVADAYRTLAALMGAADSDDVLLGGGWDPSAAFEMGATEDEDDGLLGEGLFAKLRNAVLTPLRQLTFWQGKNQAREFGEGGAARLLRAIMAATAPTVRIHLMGHSFGTIVVAGAVRGPGEVPTPPRRPVDSLFLVQGAVSLWAFAEDVPEHVGGGRGYFADVTRPEFVAGPIVVTTSKWDYAVGKFYPLAVRLARQYLLGGEELPKYGGIGAFGAQGVSGAVKLPALAPGARLNEFASGTLYNLDASAVIDALDGASGAHNDLAHPELTWIAWNMARSRMP